MTVLDDARALLATGPLCDPCLGRPFAERSHGLTNRERGRALRVAVALDDDESFAPPDETCRVCAGHASEYDAWAERAANALADTEFATYLVGTRPPPDLADRERSAREQADLPADAGESFRSECNREVGKRLGDRTDATVDFERPDVTVLVDFERSTVDVERNPAFVYGRYRKLERDVAQTDATCSACGGRGSVWREGEARPCEQCGGTGRLAETSVEELVCPPVREAMRGREAVFHGAGREEAAALVLGSGRPFVVEVKAPRRRTPDLSALADAVAERAGGRVEVEALAIAEREMVDRVKETRLRQRFRLELSFDDGVDAAAFDDAVATLDGERVRQRSEATAEERTRTLRDVTGEFGDGTATLEFAVDAGTDVPAVATGERTDPSLADRLGVDVAVTAVDVVGVTARDGSFEDTPLLGA
ncbi:tRNA pseudouridine(54/55) synthase Pus10 [Halomicrococcus gelatinilyticus]|uniref:tRNA pseudouridine(54/55) synthase Pus10 n=1 Tax=Halomicrococcus gelatinilyticus TaxID=1702103 RepID=UPI002E1290D3